MTRDFFHGFAMNAVDAKNRLSIPAAYREVVQRRSQTRTVVLAPHPRGLPCLVGYDVARTERLQQQLETKYGADYGEAREDEARALFGLSEDVDYDDNGRILLSADLRDWAEIGKLAFFIAAGDYFEIWNPQTLLQERGSDPLIARLVKRQLEAKGVQA